MKKQYLAPHIVVCSISTPSALVGSAFDPDVDLPDDMDHIILDPDASGEPD